MAENITRRGGKKNRKFGNNKIFCAKYLAEGRRMTNKLKRLTRHIKNFPDDIQAANRFKSLTNAL